MFRRPMLMLLPILFFMTGWIPVGSPGENETSGQILGGSLSSPIRIEVYSDFQCPACRDFYLGTIRQVLQEYASRDKVCVIYREFPLQMHAYAREAARYSGAAYRLGQQKLLQVMDSLYSQQAEWAQDGKLDAIVEKALSREDFQRLKKIMLDPGIDSAIDREIQLAAQKEIKSTPTMIIYYIGKQQRVEGIVTYIVLKQFIDSIVK